MASTGLKSLLDDLGMTAPIAMLTQRLGTLPEVELGEALAVVGKRLRSGIHATQRITVRVI